MRISDWSSDVCSSDLLFSAEGDGYADDAELVQRLADEKMDALEVEARAKGWGEVIVTGSRHYAAYQWEEAYPDETTRVMSDADNDTLARLQTQGAERLAEHGAAGDKAFDPHCHDVMMRSAERRVGKQRVRKCSYQCAPLTYRKKKN